MSMLEGIEPERMLKMTPQEERWLENVKKGFHESDLAVKDGKASDKCMEELFKALDAAKNLRRSMLDGAAQKANQRKQYIEFIELSVPSPEKGGMSMPLTDARTGESKSYSFAELVYDARCMLVLENENLNAEENPDYHIQFDWNSTPQSHFLGHVTDGRLVANGFLIWNRVRQLLATFITGIDGMISFQKNGSFSFTCEPELGSVKPSNRQ